MWMCSNHSLCDLARIETWCVGFLFGPGNFYTCPYSLHVLSTGRPFHVLTVTNSIKIARLRLLCYGAVITKEIAKQSLGPRGLQSFCACPVHMSGSRTSKYWTKDLGHTMLEGHQGLGKQPPNHRLSQVLWQALYTRGHSLVMGPMRPLDRPCPHRIRTTGRADSCHTPCRQGLCDPTHTPTTGPVDPCYRPCRQDLYIHPDPQAYDRPYAPPAHLWTSSTPYYCYY